jgi:hypothetical protein
MFTGEECENFASGELGAIRDLRYLVHKQKQTKSARFLRNAEVHLGCSTYTFQQLKQTRFNMSTGFLASNMSLTSIQALSLAIPAAIFCVVIYRLYFHPLAKVPGPRLAAITWLYQTYYSFVGGSRFYLQIEKLHEIYG